VSFRDALFPDLAKQTFDSWLALRVDGKVPRKDDLCPLGLPRATLPFVILVEHESGEDFRCRVAGAAIRDWYGVNIVGRSMRELIPPAAHAQRAPLLRHCLETGAPAWFIGPLLVHGEPMRRAGRLMLPVAFGDDRPNGLVLIAFIDETKQSVADSIALDTAIVCPPEELG
jgi:hypothetical protein